MSSLVPAPRHVETRAGGFAFSPHLSISGNLSQPVRVALASFDLRPVDRDGAIVASLDTSLGAEEYTLEVSGSGVAVAAGSPAGAFYAGQTLRQLLPDNAFRSVSSGGTIEAVSVRDRPEFGWRGVLLDVARHFQPKREVLRMVDLLAAHKLNRLHLHLGDDQGWRVESKAFPRLHEVASFRSQSMTSYYLEEPEFDGQPHGGFYTLEDLAEIAEYARARAVTIVPEIDVPGHASAILAAEPSLGLRKVEVLDRWGISPAILSPLPPTVDFLTTVIDEILGALGPTPFFHLGGDECVLDDWANSPEIVEYQKSLGLQAVSDLHAWFLRRLADILAERGTRAVVWDEAFVSGHLRSDTIVMPWRGMNVARRAAAAGHDVVQTPVFPLYFDYAEAASVDEPLAIGDSITIDDVAAFDPAPADWKPEEAARVLGVQAQLWSERIPDARTLDYRAWPRTCVLADIGWFGPSADLAHRLERHLSRLDALGVEYRPLAGPRPWQRGGGKRAHRPEVILVSGIMRHLEELTHAADSTRPSL